MEIEFTRWMNWKGSWKMWQLIETRDRGRGSNTSSWMGLPKQWISDISETEEQILDRELQKTNLSTVASSARVF